MASPQQKSASQGMTLEQELDLARQELLRTRCMTAPVALFFFVLFVVSLTGRLAPFQWFSLYAGSHCLAITSFTFWQDSSDLSRIRQLGPYREGMHFLLSTIGFLICAVFEEEHNETLLRLTSAFLLPMSTTYECRDASNFSPLAAYLGTHALMTLMRFGGELMSGSWQFCLVVCITDTILVNLAYGRAAVRSDKEQLMSLCRTVQRLLSTMCDGYCVLNSDGVVMGADRKLGSALCLGAGDPTMDGRQFRDLMTQDSPAECGRSEGLRTARFHTTDDCIWEAEVYTVASTLTTTSMRGILGSGFLGPDEDIDGFLCAVRQVGTVEKSQTSAALDADRAEAHEMADLSTLASTGQEDAASDVDSYGGLPADDHSVLESPRTQDWKEVPLAGAAESVASESGLSEVRSLPNSVATQGGFFPPISALGIGVGEYTKVELVNRGAQGAVWKVRSTSGDLHAMKELRLPGLLWRRDFTPNLVRADREVRCMKQMRWASSVIVQIIESWLREDMTLCIVMEWHPMTLKSLLARRRNNNEGPPPGEDTCRWLAHIVAAVAAIHAEGFMHRDIKPSNLLLTGDMYWCRVADFGLSRPSTPQRPEIAAETASSIGGDSETVSLCSGYTTKCGTRGFQSPEILSGRNYDSATDIYSIGCVLLELLSLCKLDTSPVKPEMAASVLAQSIRQAGGVRAAPVLAELQQLCLQMLCESPAERPNALTLAQASVLKPQMEGLLLEHPELNRVFGAVLAAPQEERDSAPEGGGASASEDALGSLEVDACGRIRAWSDSLARALGVPRERALGRLLLEAFVPPSSRTEFSRLVGPVVRCLAQEADGPMTLEAASCRLRCWASVRTCGPPSRSLPHHGRPCCPGLLVTLRAAGPDVAESAAFPWQCGAGAAAADHGQDDGASCSTAPATGRSDVQTIPAHLVSHRSASHDAFATPEGVRERQVRTWSSIHGMDD